MDEAAREAAGVTGAGAQRRTRVWSRQRWIRLHQGYQSPPESPAASSPIKAGPSGAAAEFGPGGARAQSLEGEAQGAAARAEHGEHAAHRLLNRRRGSSWRNLHPSRSLYDGLPHAQHQSCCLHPLSENRDPRQTVYPGAGPTAEERLAAEEEASKEEGSAPQAASREASGIDNTQAGTA